MSEFASSVCFNMADLFTEELEDAQNSDEGLGSGSEGGMSGDGDDELCDEPSSSLEEMCQGARIDLLEEHQRSDNPYHRQAVVRTLQSSLRAVGGTREDAERLLAVATQLSQDNVEDIRCDLVDQVPHLAMVCSGLLDERGVSLGNLIPTHLLPIVLNLLSDQNKMIHKTAQGALLSLLEQRFLPPDVVEEKLVPLVVNYTLIEDVELNTASVGLMTKMAPIIGQDPSVNYFLYPFSELCGDSQLYVRKVCATNFGDFAAAIGQNKSEDLLLPRFLMLCRDAEWAVRKACAEVFTSVSHAVSMARRRTVLAATFHNLLRDDSRWVQVAAFQSLGSFIATFGDPGQYPSAYNHHVLLDTEGVELAYRAEANCGGGGVTLYDGDVERLLGLSPQLSQSAQNLGDNDDDDEDDIEQEVKIRDLESDLKILSIRDIDEWDEDVEYEYSSGSVFLNMSQQPPPQPPPPDKEPGEENFNTFQYWRLPVPELDLNDTLPPPAAQKQATCDTSLTPPMSPLASLMPDHLPSPSPSLSLPPTPPSTAGEHTQASSVSELTSQESPPGESLPSQEIVPAVLISHFVSMATPTARTVDSEISHHCAFSLPAVVLTLGRDNWPLLKKTYQNLAGDMQWKVRRTMASSIHEIALILGQDLASTDLMPIFYGFVKDLDEVRIGILKHLTEFLKILRKEECNDFLPSLSKFLQMDHHSNWRYREELALQLTGVLDLCTPEQARAHVAPIALALLDDRVAAVREAALPLTTKVTLKLAEEYELLDRLICRFKELFVTTERWMRRQSFALLCGHIMRPPQPALSPEIFCERLLPLLADLATDRVPNVRLAVAQSLTIDIDPHPYFSVSPGKDQVQEVLQVLQQDCDRDVKYFSGGISFLDQDMNMSILSPLHSTAHFDSYNTSATSLEDAPQQPL